MERKTIGGFIAALRRANGMTQRELADRLNVSDKTVSRWERDESAPELAAIPVIAEIFGVSCDELLRGERRPPEEPAGYLLMDNGGRLALYAADGTGPLAEYDIYTRLLPEQDFLALQQGVAVADEAELQKRLEDYGW